MAVADVVAEKEGKEKEGKEKEKEESPRSRACAMNCKEWRSRCAGISVCLLPRHRAVASEPPHVYY
jgi:hypothetical protein